MPTGFNGLLTATVFLPAVAALLLALGILRNDRAIRWYAAAVAFADLVLSVIVFVLFTPGGDRFQLVDRFDWIDTGTVQASYLLGVDGISAPLVMLTGLLGFVRRVRVVPHRRPSEGIFHLAVCAANGGDGGIHVAGLPVVLPVLGDRADSDVPADLDLGNGTSGIFGDEIPDFHHPGIGVHAGRHRRGFREFRRGQLRHDEAAGAWRRVDGFEGGSADGLCCSGCSSSRSP